MPRSFSVIEPHPNPSTTYLPTGRGGAGNIIRSSNITHGKDARGPPSKTSLAPRRPSNTFISGRGGAGNVHPASERAIFSFDEELERQMKFEQGLAPVFHTGRGGMGNMHSSSSSASSYRKNSYSTPSTEHRQSALRRDSEAESVRSNGSAESGADAMNRKVKRSLEKFIAGFGSSSS